MDYGKATSTKSYFLRLNIEVMMIDSLAKCMFLYN